MNKLIIVGSSGHSKVVIDAVEKANKYEIIGLIDDFRPIGERHCNYSIIGKIEDLYNIVKKNKLLNIFIAVGDNYNRKLIYDRIVDVYKDFNFVNIIHPTAILSEKIKNIKGVFIAAGSIINKNSKIGDFAIINTGAIIEHDNNIGCYSSIGPNATLSGNVIVGENTAVGVNATIIEKIKIGDNCVIGAGSVVINDIPANSVVVGVPGKVIKSRKKNDTYLK